MTHTVTTDLQAPRAIKMSEMQRGQIGVITSRAHEGRVVICAYGGVIVDLSRGDTWNDSLYNSNEVRLLSPGTAVTIVIGR